MNSVRVRLRPGITVLLVPAADTSPGPVDRAADGSSGPVAGDRAGLEGLPPWRRAELLAGRAALRHLLAEVLPEARDATVAYADSGRPYLVGWPYVGISIAHDAGSVAAGVAVGHTVGVDVQHPADTVPDSLLHRCLRQHTDELARLPMRHRATELAWVWTVQEACVKAAGTGMAGQPWSIDVRPYAHHGRWGRYRWTSLREASDIPFSCAYAPLPGSR
ncbi:MULTISPECIES: 4'-phosphopantetheinyl transferase superfamily protein [unclassified Micromonospora]|uniref:4'-phosphopantetheinyl transferase family protein n=1 Tax=unclassified Micromonospora TaxID=2617518 RepID=UPI0024167BAF|nr:MULTISPECIES: 4'-phosphopantetheinyl transferase superfamily protein [unclassified Micromonospora]MDG4820142.1 4'-phosphopantetheinyl transferase superfamily protein [Micromonospora sp. WMMD956]WFE56554.1 4'-phosphopantetheinyl transferase superfamily protein [Micromonospora sp. WMMD712]